MKKFITSLFYFAILIFLGIASVYGVKTRKNAPVFAVGNMQLTVFENGIGFFQKDRHYYYTFSPFNDYLISTNGDRSALFSKEEIENKSFTSDYKKSHLKEIIQIIKSYINKAQPSIKFNTDKEVEYVAEINGNKVVIKRTLSLKSKFNRPEKTGIVLPYEGIDFVYDKQGNLYNYQLEEDIEFFKKLYGIDLKYEIESARIEVPGKTIIVSNPNIAGAMIIKANQNQKIIINVDYHLIEIEEAISNPEKHITEVEVEVYENPKKVSFKASNRPRMSIRQAQDNLGGWTLL